jgi:hypothetical protein
LIIDVRHGEDREGTAHAALGRLEWRKRRWWWWWLLIPGTLDPDMTREGGRLGEGCGGGKGEEGVLLALVLQVHPL